MMHIHSRTIALAVAVALALSALPEPAGAAGGLDLQVKPGQPVELPPGGQTSLLLTTSGSLTTSRVADPSDGRA